MAGKSLSHKPFEIPDDNPFANCKLKREQYADVLTNIVENYSDGFVLAINNGWGQGKTTFIKMWKQKLNNLEFNTLYFNAWENDFQDDVILALISELEELRSKSNDKFDTFIGKTAKFMQKAAPAVIKGAASKLIGDEATVTVVEAAVKFTADEVEASLKNLKERKKGIVEFRKSLEKFATAVDNEKPIVFFIDELDRCRPNYSVKILEKIKHFFNVPGIVFVLSIDKKQLCHAIKGVYGSEGFNAKEYLKRFIDLEYSIPDPDINKVVHYYFQYFEIDTHYLSLSKGSRAISDEFNTLVEALRVMILVGSLNLRDVEKILAHFKIVISSFQKNETTFPEIILLILYLKKTNIDIIENILNKIYSPQELISKLERVFIVSEGDEGRQKRVLSFLLARFIYAYCHYLKGMFRPDDMFTVQGEKNIFKLKTSFDQQKFEDVFIGRNNDFLLNDLDLDWLNKKIELTEKIIG